MRFALTVTLILAAATARGEAPREIAAAIEALTVDSACEITITKQTLTSKTTAKYVGLVAATYDDRLVLRDVSTKARTEHGVPILAKIPSQNRLYKTVGVGRAHLGDVEIALRRDQITAVRPLTTEQFEDLSAPK
jgi:hypothetical protein